MNDRAVSLFEKYDLEIEKTRKGRGMLIATTPHGEIALTEYAGSVDRLLFVREKMEQIAQKFDGKLDHILPTTRESYTAAIMRGRITLQNNIWMDLNVMFCRSGSA